MKLPTALLAACTAITAVATPADSTDTGALLRRIGAATAPVARFEQEAFIPNPASMFYLMPFSLSDFRISGSLADSDEPAVVQQGTGHAMASVSASSYLRMNSSAVVWGAADFTTGRRRDILWNNAADYILVAPYTLADSVGGNLSLRSYSFSGGYSGKARRWTWGAEASYRAEIDYRNRDPRDKTVVSDLQARAGATLLAARRYIIGAGADLRVYNQESDVDFYNPNNDIRTYLLTGLGNTYARFSGNSSRNTAYKGIGYGAVVQLIPASATGFSLSARLGKLRITQVLRDYNNLDLTRSDTYTLSLRSSYILRTGAVTTGAMLTAEMSRRPGYENIFGTSVGSNYTKIGTRRNYLHDLAEVTLAVPVSLDASETVKLHLLPAVSGCYSHEDYRRPARALEASAVTPSMEAKLTWKARPTVTWGLDLFGSHRFNTAERRLLTGLDTGSGIGQAVLHNFSMLTAGLSALSAGISATSLLQPSIALRISAKGEILAWHSHGTSRHASLTAALIF